MTEDQIVESAIVALDGRLIKGCPHVSHKHDEPKGSELVIERAWDQSLFEPCEAHKDIWLNPPVQYRRIR